MKKKIFIWEIERVILGEVIKNGYSKVLSFM